MKIGDKVIPITRNIKTNDTRGLGEPNWRDARARGDYFLWVCDIEEDKSVLWLSDNKQNVGRGHVGYDYLISDVIPYSENEAAFQRAKSEK